MTFFPQDKKTVSEIIKKNSNLGPGSYNNAESMTKSRSYAPFGSLSRKDTAVKTDKQELLGPGSYNIKREIIKPSILQYQNQNCIIIKIEEDGSSQFKSNQPRFGLTVCNQVPGPGAYNVSTKSQGHKKKRTQSVGAAVHKMKQLYENEYKKKMKPVLTTDAVEFGESESASAKLNAKGVVKWSLNRRQRFQTSEKELFREEDKSYFIEKMQEEKKKGKMTRESSFFASNSIKSSFDELIYQSSNPYMVQMRKMVGFESSQPGPGSYNICSEKSFKGKKKFQFFGSTANRFRTETSENQLGPGYYNYQSFSSKNPESKIKKKPRSTEKKVKTEPEQEVINLGPGSYEVESSHFAKSSFNNKYNLGVGDFGSKKPRFEEPVEDRQKYNEYVTFKAAQDEQRRLRLQQEFNYRRNAVLNREQAVFASQSKRSCFQDAQFRRKNPFGTYEIGIEDIGRKLKKQEQYSQQFAECNLQKPGFMSSVQRFQEKKEPEVVHKDCWCLIKEVQKKHSNHMSPCFYSQSKRIQVFDSKNKGPAVGQYSKISSFVKDSFNSKFIKQGQNITKKIKVWKEE